MRRSITPSTSSLAPNTPRLLGLIKGLALDDDGRN
jgi:hypothetical protein